MQKITCQTGIITLFLMLISIAGHSQNNYRNLVFEGGGIRGIAYAGVLEELEKKGILQNIEKVAGTSAGAIVALTVALQYTPEEIKHIIHNTDFEKFNDGQYLFPGGIYRTLNHYGWYRSSQFEKWLANIIAVRTGNPDITFEELSKAGFRSLYVTGTSLSAQKLVLFSEKTYPKMKVKDAVRISMSIPFYFEAAFIDSTGEVHKQQNADNSLEVVVDGGIIGNFPIFIFDSIVKVNGYEVRVPNPQTLGIRLDSDEQIAYDQQNRMLIPVPISNMQTYIEAFYSVVIENLNRSQLTPDDWHRTLSVSSVGIGPKVRRLSKYEKDLLVESGRKCTDRFFSP